MYGNLWMGAVATAGRGEGGWSSPRMTVAGRWLVQGGREEKESLPRAVVLALSGRPTSRPPRSRRIAPVSPPPAFVGPLVPPFSNARIEPPPSSSTLLHFFSPSPFRSVFIFLAFLLIFDFVAEFVDFSSFSIESIAGEFGEILLNFPSFPFECYFDFAFRFPSFLLVDLDRFTGFSLKEQIVSLNFLPRFFLDLDPRRIGAGCEFYLTFSLLLFLLSIFIFIFFVFPLSIPIESIAGESETLLNFFSTFFPLRIYFHFHFFLDFFSIESIARKFVRSNKPCLNFSIYFFEPILIFTFGDRIDSIG